MTTQKERTKKILVHLLRAALGVVLAGCGIFGVFWAITVKENRQLIEDLGQRITYAPERQQEELAYLESLPERKFLTNDQRGTIYEDISLLYRNTNILKYYRNLGYALYYYEQAGNEDKVINIYGDLSKYFLENDAVDVAYEMLQRSYDVRPLKNFDSAETKSHIYRIQGMIFGMQGTYQKGIGYLEQAVAQSKMVEQSNPAAARECLCLAKVQQAIFYLKDGMAEEARGILHTYSYEELSEEDGYQQNVISEYQIPYLECELRLAMWDGEDQQALELLNRYCEYCDRFGYDKQKLNMLLYYSEYYGNVEGDRQLREIAGIINRAYAKITDMQSGEYNQLLAQELLAARGEMAALYERQMRRTVTILIVLATLLVLIILLTILNVALGNSRRDALTGLKNRRALDGQIQRGSRRGQSYCAIMCDVDNFKKVNDTYGHEVGDYVLQILGKILRSYESMTVQPYRYGGEEFVVVLPAHSVHQLVQVAEGIRSAVEHHPWEHGLKITISLGVAYQESTDRFITVADENLYYAKKNGKNVVVYNEGEEKRLYR